MFIFTNRIVRGLSAAVTACLCAICLALNASAAPGGYESTSLSLHSAAGYQPDISRATPYNPILPGQARNAPPFAAPEPDYPQLNIALPAELQKHTWELCGEYETPLSQEEFYYLVIKVMWMESRCTPGVRDNLNPNGTKDRGLMQINSCNWGWLAEEGFDVSVTEDNIESGVYMLSGLLNKYPVRHALTAYVWGEGGAKRAGGSSPYAATVLSLPLQDIQLEGEIQAA